jgi:hypothetical protein
MPHGSHVNWELGPVPLIVTAPGVAPGVAPGYVENIDILPTLLSLARLEVPKAAQGRSLLPWLADPKRTKGLAAVVTSLTRYNHSVITQAGLQLIHPTPRGECDFAILDEIYDLPRDPEARSNLVGSRREAVQRLGRLAEERARSGLLGATHSTDPKTIQALKTLGYVGGDVVDSVREEIAAMSTENLVQGLAEEADCLLRYQRVRALEGRELSALERSALEAAAAQDGSEAVRAGIRALLGR